MLIVRDFISSKQSPDPFFGALRWCDRLFCVRLRKPRNRFFHRGRVGHAVFCMVADYDSFGGGGATNVINISAIGPRLNKIYRELMQREAPRHHYANRDVVDNRRRRNREQRGGRRAVQREAGATRKADTCVAVVNDPGLGIKPAKP
jgi:hypothetical protein